MLLNKENLQSLIHSVPLKNQEYIDYFSNFTLLGVLGEGTFGKVFQVVENGSGREYAIKKIQAPFSGVNAVERFQELEILWQLER
jgi:serine/threonine protein kinase